SVIRYVKYDAESTLRQDVENSRIDAGWIFPADLNQRIERYTAGETKVKLVSVLERGSGISLNLSHERLYGALFPHISYGVYQSYLQENIEQAAKMDEATLRHYYSKVMSGGDLVRCEYFGGGAVRQENYLILPLRGLLTILLLLCGFAGMMYHLQDARAGVYDWLPAGKRILPAVGNILVATTDAAVAMGVALACTGLCHSWKEIPALILLVACGTAFCLAFGMLCRKETVLSAVVPITLLLMLIICPVFYSFSPLSWLRPLCPMYYYLYAVSNLKFLLYGVLYILAAGLLVWGMERFKNRKF
ncbi:MAG: ABC transporter permease, partial [Clostridia bacterium]|nr:ABC transporter permease [Clostridia bacterium]